MPEPEILMMQVGTRDKKCRFEDPLVQEALPSYVKLAVRASFINDQMRLVSMTWGEGESATFFLRRPDDEIVPAIEVLDPEQPKTSQEIYRSLRDILTKAIEEPMHDYDDQGKVITKDWLQESLAQPQHDYDEDGHVRPPI